MLCKADCDPDLADAVVVIAAMCVLVKSWVEYSDYFRAHGSHYNPNKSDSHRREHTDDSKQPKHWGTVT